MKKLAIAIFAVVCVAMFIAPSFAEDRVSLSGSLRFRGWDKSLSNGSDASYIDQRLRLDTRINIADDVSVRFRADYGDGTWGKDYTTSLNGVRPRGGNTPADYDHTRTIDVDYSYLSINKEMWALSVGQQFMGLGHLTEVIDSIVTGAILRIKLPVEVSLRYGKIDENGSTNDDGDNDDTDLYAINFAYGTDAFNLNLYGATIDDGSDVEYSPIMYGVSAATTLDIVSIIAELDFATGDTDNGDTDYMGIQFYLSGTAKINDAFNLGAEILYALGTDDADEVQLTNLGNWGLTFAPMSNNTPLAGDWSYAVDANPFDPTGDSAGVQGITLFTDYKVIDGMSLGTKVGYFTPEEDDATTIDSITSLNVWASYMLATNTEFAIAYFYNDVDDDDPATTYTDEEKTIEARLVVNF